MKKNITVIAKERSKTKDPIKRIQRVSMGYAFNYLIPKQIAEVATKGKVKHLNMLHDKISKNRDLAYNQNIKAKYKLKNINIILIRKQCSPSKLIFGRISEQDIATKILELTGQKVEKKQIRIIGNKKLGKHKAEIVIEENINTLLDLHILPKTL